MEGRYNAEGSDRQTDEFMKPVILNKDGLIQGLPVLVCWREYLELIHSCLVLLLILFLFLTDGDTLLFFDFRADRMRQIVEAFGIKPQFDTTTVPKNLVSLSHTHTHNNLPLSNLIIIVSL